jgi:hypothetical protein
LYPLFKSGTFSLRFKVNITAIAATQYLADFRASSGVGYALISNV